MTEFQPLQELERVLGHSGPLPAVLFPPNSRYNGVPIATLTAPDGTEIPYLRRRFVPPPAAFDSTGTYPVAEGDRLDNVTFRLLGDPELFWRMCDANRAVFPAELEEVGKPLAVPLPLGVRAAKQEG